MAKAEDVIAKLTEQKTVIDSVKVGVDEAKAKLAELRALVVAGQADPAKLDEAIALIDSSDADLTSKKDELAVAVATPLA